MLIRAICLPLTASLLWLTFNLQSAAASMCMTEVYPGDKVIAFFQKKAAAKDPKATEVYRLLQIGRDAIGVTEYRMCKMGSFEESVVDLGNHRIKYIWLAYLGQKSSWERSMPSSALEALKAEKKFLNKFFGEKSFGYAWVLNTLGERSAAKALLHEVFENSVISAMKQRQVTRSFESPSSRIETTYEALTTLSSPEELKEYEEKLKKVKIHLSNLPDSGILT